MREGDKAVACFHIFIIIHYLIKVYITITVICFINK